MRQKPEDLLQLAYLAAARSLDPLTQFGAVLVDELDPVRTQGVYLAYNAECHSGMTNPAEWRDTVVRESVTISPVARLLVQEQAKMRRPILAVTCGVYSSCAKLIAASQVETVIVHEPLVKEAKSVSTYQEISDLCLGDEILERANVEVIRHGGAIQGGEKIRFKGRLWCPLAMAFVA